MATLAPTGTACDGTREMNVRELIALLADEDPDQDVSVEGCDCVEGAVGVSPSVDRPGLIIRRDNGAMFYDKIPVRRPEPEGR